MGKANLLTFYSLENCRNVWEERVWLSIVAIQELSKQNLVVTCIRGFDQFTEKRSNRFTNQFTKVLKLR